MASMKHGPFSVERLADTSFIHSTVSNKLCLDDNEFSIAQKLARRILKHQQFQEDLSKCGLIANTTLISERHFSSKKPNKNSAPEACQKINVNHVKATLPSVLRECRSVSNEYNTCGGANDHNQEVRQMRRAIKAYTNKLLLLRKSTPIKDSREHAPQERCLNAQVARTLYSLTKQLENPTALPKSDVPSGGKSAKGMTMQQLSSVHKSAIRCLSSFIHQNDQGAGEASVLVPSTKLYGQLCSLLEKLSTCYDQYSSVQDPFFVESIQELKTVSPARVFSPAKARSDSRKLVKRHRHSSSRTLLPSPYDLGNNTKSIAHIKPVEPTNHDSLQQTTFVRGGQSSPDGVIGDNYIKVRDLVSSSPEARKCPPSKRQDQSSLKKPNKNMRTQDRDKKKERKPLLQMLVGDRSGGRLLKSSSPGNDYLLPVSPSEEMLSKHLVDLSLRRAPSNCANSGEMCRLVNPVEIEHRIQQIEAETILIRQRWFESPANLIHVQDSTDLHGHNFVDYEFEAQSSVLNYAARPVASPASASVPIEQPLCSDRIVEVVENRILEGIIDDVVLSEVEALEVIANRLVDHLLTTELYLAD